MHCPLSVDTAPSCMYTYSQCIIHLTYLLHLVDEYRCYENRILMSTIFKVNMNCV